jgi:hypothetical protein
MKVKYNKDGFEIIGIQSQINGTKISTSIYFLNQKPNHLFFYSFYWCALIVKKSERCGRDYS